MGRKASPLYQNPDTKIYYARWHEGTQRIMLSLNTTDETEAMKRFPFVQKAKISWSDLQKSLQSMNSLVINQIGDNRITPPITANRNPALLEKLIREEAKTGNAVYDPSRGYWIFTGITADGQTIPTDSTAMPALPGPPNESLLRDVEALQSSIGTTDDFEEIKQFYNVIVPQLYTDKKTAERFSSIWLSFLAEKGVTSWLQIDEPLLIEFKEWRKTKKINRGKAVGVLPSAEVINRQIKFLSRSFEEARDRGAMKTNPVKNWKPEAHRTPRKTALTLNELKGVLNLCKGILRDVILLLFVSCKRRTEIVNLKIENINLSEHWAHYVETKNSSKGTAYEINKSFHLTPEMEVFLRRIIGERISGPLFPGLDPDHVSQVFEEHADTIASSKNVSLHNLRHTGTTLMEAAGLTDEEIDAALGHYNPKTALSHYQDRSADAIARRLSEKTKKGISVLSKAVEDFLISPRDERQGSVTGPDAIGYPVSGG